MFFLIEFGNNDDDDDDQMICYERTREIRNKHVDRMKLKLNMTYS